jgi:hypothetical protein
MAVNDTPAKRSFFIVLPQAVVTDACRRTCDLDKRGAMFRFGSKKKRCGFPRRLVKIKYAKPVSWDGLHT